MCLGSTMARLRKSDFARNWGQVLLAPETAARILTAPRFALAVSNFSVTMRFRADSSETRAGIIFRYIRGGRALKLCSDFFPQLDSKATRARRLFSTPTFPALAIPRSEELRLCENPKTCRPKAKGVGLSQVRPMQKAKAFAQRRKGAHILFAVLCDFASLRALCFLGPACPGRVAHCGRLLRSADAELNDFTRSDLPSLLPRKYA